MYSQIICYNPNLMSSESNYPIHLSDPSKALIDADYNSKVLPTIKSDKVISIGIKISDGTASADEVLEWYKSQDPLEESLFRGGENRSEESIHKDFIFILERSRTYEKAAKIYLKNSGLTSNDFVLREEIVQKLKDGQLDKNHIRDLLLGTDIYSAAGRDADLAWNYKKLPEYQAKYGEELDELEKRMSDQFNFILDNTKKICEGLFQNKNIHDRQILTLGLEALLFHVNEIGFSKQDEEILVRDKRKDYLNIMLNYFDEFIFERDLLSSWDESHKKGKLLELLWTLDGYFYLTMQRRYFASVVPALNYEDAPHVGYPALNRGVDVFVFDQDKEIDLPIQLKNSMDKQSHPSIEVVVENNFQDYIPERLRTKFQAYRKALESDFAEEERAEALKYVLPSVIKTLSKGASSGYNRFRKAKGWKEDPFGNSLGLLESYNIPLNQPTTKENEDDELPVSEWFSELIGLDNK